MNRAFSAIRGGAPPRSMSQESEWEFGRSFEALYSQARLQSLENGRLRSTGQDSRRANSRGSDWSESVNTPERLTTSENDPDVPASSSAATGTSTRRTMMSKARKTGSLQWASRHQLRSERDVRSMMDPDEWLQYDKDIEGVCRRVYGKSVLQNRVETLDKRLLRIHDQTKDARFDTLIYTWRPVAVFASKRRIQALLLVLAALQLYPIIVSARAFAAVGLASHSQYRFTAEGLRNGLFRGVDSPHIESLGLLFDGCLVDKSRAVLSVDGASMMLTFPESVAMNGWTLETPKDSDPNQDPVLFLLEARDHLAGGDAAKWRVVGASSRAWFGTSTMLFSSKNKHALTTERGAVVRFSSRANWEWLFSRVLRHFFYLMGLLMLAGCGLVHSEKRGKRIVVACCLIAATLDLVAVMGTDEGFKGLSAVYVCLNSVGVIAICAGIMLKETRLLLTLYAGGVYFLILQVCCVSTLPFSSGIPFRGQSHEGVVLVDYHTIILICWNLFSISVQRYMWSKEAQNDREHEEVKKEYDTIFANLQKSQDNLESLRALISVVSRISQNIASKAGPPLQSIVTGEQHELRSRRQMGSSVVEMGGVSPSQRHQSTTVRSQALYFSEAGAGLVTASELTLKSPKKRSGRAVTVKSLDQLFSQAQGLVLVLQGKVKSWARGCRGCFFLSRRGKGLSDENKGGRKGSLLGMGFGGMIGGSRGRRGSAIEFYHGSFHHNEAANKGDFSAMELEEWDHIRTDDSKKSKILWTPIKTEMRAIEKLTRCYGRRVARLVDVCREQIIFQDLDHLIACLETIVRDEEVMIERVKNRLNPSYNSDKTLGYRDVMLNLRIVSGETRFLGLDQHVCELQLVLAQFAKVKMKAGNHARYIESRNKRDYIAGHRELQWQTIKNMFAKYVLNQKETESEVGKPNMASRTSIASGNSGDNANATPRADAALGFSSSQLTFSTEGAFSHVERGRGPSGFARVKTAESMQSADGFRDQRLASGDRPRRKRSSHRNSRKRRSGSPQGRTGTSEGPRSPRRTGTAEGGGSQTVVGGYFGARGAGVYGEEDYVAWDGERDGGWPSEEEMCALEEGRVAHQGSGRGLGMPSSSLQVSASNFGADDLDRPQPVAPPRSRPPPRVPSSLLVEEGGNSSDMTRTSNESDKDDSSMVMAAVVQPGQLQRKRRPPSIERPSLPGSPMPAPPTVDISALKSASFDRLDRSHGFDKVGTFDKSATYDSAGSSQATDSVVNHHAFDLRRTSASFGGDIVRRLSSCGTAGTARDRSPMSPGQRPDSVATTSDTGSDQALSDLGAVGGGKMPRLPSVDEEIATSGNAVKRGHSPSTPRSPTRDDQASHPELKRPGIFRLDNAILRPPPSVESVGRASTNQKTVKVSTWDNTRAESVPGIHRTDGSGESNLNQNYFEGGGTLRRQPSSQSEGGFGKHISRTASFWDRDGEQRMVTDMVRMLEDNNRVQLGDKWADSRPEVVDEQCMIKLMNDLSVTQQEFYRTLGKQLAESQYICSCLRPVDMLDRKLRLVHRAMESASSASVIWTSTPSAACASKPVFQALMVAIGLYYLFGRIDQVSTAVSSRGLRTFSKFRLTVLRQRDGTWGGGLVTGAVQSPHVEGFGLQLDGCPITEYMPVSATETGPLLTVDYSGPVSMNGWYIKTASSNSEKDPQDWILQGQDPSGGAWKEVDNSNWSAGIKKERGVLQTFDLRASWPTLLAMSGTDYVEGIGFLMVAVAGLRNKSSWASLIFMMSYAIVVPFHVCAGIGHLAVGEARESFEDWRSVLHSVLLGGALSIWQRHMVRIIVIDGIIYIIGDVIVYAALIDSPIDIIASTRGIGYVECAIGLLFTLFRWRSVSAARRLVKFDKRLYVDAWVDVQSREKTQGTNQVQRLKRTVQRLAGSANTMADVRQRFRVSVEDNGPVGMPGAGGALLVGQGARLVPVKSLDQIYAQAQGMHFLLLYKVRQWASETHGCFAFLPENKKKVKLQSHSTMTQASLDSLIATNPSHSMDNEKATTKPMFLEWSHAKTDAALAERLRFGGVKGVDRAIEKALRSYNRDVSRLVDVCRQMIIFKEVDHLNQCLEAMERDEHVVVERIKNRMDPSYDASLTVGYRDVMVNLRIVSNESRFLGLDMHVCEVQLVLQRFAELRHQEGHQRYIRLRNARGE